MLVNYLCFAGEEISFVFPLQGKYGKCLYSCLTRNRGIFIVNGFSSMFSCLSFNFTLFEVGSCGQRPIPCECRFACNTSSFLSYNNYAMKVLSHEQKAFAYRYFLLGFCFSLLAFFLFLRLFFHVKLQVTPTALPLF